MDHHTPFPPDFRLILASQSPRRHSLLREIGVPFTVVPTDAEESLEGASIPQLTETNALAKVTGAAPPAACGLGDFVLGTDTLVGVDGRVMGKARSAAEAHGMLAALSGRTHQVVSGVALARLGERGWPVERDQVRLAHAVTEVTFVELDDAQRRAYVASGEWRGKAGAYAVQGLAGLWVHELRGEYSNVVGLPLCLLGRLFRGWGFDLVRREWLTSGDTGDIVTAAYQ